MKEISQEKGMGSKDSGESGRLWRGERSRKGQGARELIRGLDVRWRVWGWGLRKEIEELEKEE